MKIIDLLKSDKVTVSFEVFPPKSEANYESIYNAAMNVAALKPAYMSVTYGAGGSTSKSTLDIAGDIQKRYDVCTIAHLTCAGADKDDIHRSLDGMKTKGIENILALRGDRPKDYDGDPFAHYRYATLRDMLMPLIRRKISVTLRKRLRQVVNFLRHRCFLIIISTIISFTG